MLLEGAIVPGLVPGETSGIALHLAFAAPAQAAVAYEVLRK